MFGPRSSPLRMCAGWWPSRALETNLPKIHIDELHERIMHPACDFDPALFLPKLRQMIFTKSEDPFYKYCSAEILPGRMRRHIVSL